MINIPVARPCQWIGNRHPDPVPGLPAEDRRQHEADQHIHQRPARNGDQMGLPFLRRMAERQSTQRPEQHFVRLPAHQPAGDAVTELMQQDQQHEAAHHQGHDLRMKRLRIRLVGRTQRPGQLDDDESQEQHVDANPDARDPADLDRPRHRIVKRRAVRPIAPRSAKFVGRIIR